MEIYENSGIDISKVNYDTKIIEVSVCLKNTTEEENYKNNNTQKMRVDGVKQPVAFYSLDVILVVGYTNTKRVKERFFC